jgi:hypothetical protein
VAVPAVRGAGVLGWVKLAGGYLKLSYTPVFLDPNEVMITEAMYSPATAIAATGEWLEISNRSGVVLDLAGWTLDFGDSQTHTLASANGLTSVPPGGSLLLGQSATGAASDGAPVQYVYGTGLTMNDTTGRVTLARGVTPVTSLSWEAGKGGLGISVVGDLGPILLSTDGSGTPAHAANCSATVPFGTQSPQQQGTPGSYSKCFGYALSSIPGDFEDLSADGTEVAVSDNDDGTATIALPAPFTYFGQSFTSVEVSTNGFLAFGAALADAYPNNPSKPTGGAPMGVLAPYWEDLIAKLDGKVLVARRATYTVISWNDFSSYENATFYDGDSLHFQVKLFDSGVIELHYGAMTPDPENIRLASGGGATTWVESLDGTAALVVNLNTAEMIRPNTGYRFNP